VLLVRQAHLVGDHPLVGVRAGMRGERPVNTEPHEVTDACFTFHCHWCNVDEPGEGYIVCPECFHLYRTAGELRREYRRQRWKLHRRWLARERRGTAFAPEPTWKVVWAIITVRAKKITFCQHCIHDF
jgi:hypothetical protein